MKISRALQDAVLPASLVIVTAAWAVLAGTVPREWAYPAFLIAGMLSGDLMVRFVFNLADTPHERPVPWDGTEPPPEPVAPPLRGGSVIGFLERSATIASPLTGHVAGIGVVVAVKGLARYGEFTTARQREQFIIGTLTSLLWAALFAAAALWFTTEPGPFAA